MLLGRIEMGGSIRYCESDGDTVHLLEGGPAGGFQRSDRAAPDGEYRILSPVQPGTLLVILGGFPKGKSRDEARQNLPKFAAKLPSSVIGHGDDIVVPAEIGAAVTIEPELAVVIGAPARRLRPEEAMSAVLGFTCLNDVTHLPFIREQNDFLRAKSVDTFGPLGPWIDTELSEADVTAGLEIRALVNGEVVHRGDTAEFTHSVAEVISEASRYYTLAPGDVVSLGTPLDPVTANIGDTVTVEIGDLPGLTNQLVGEGTRPSPAQDER